MEHGVLVYDIKCKDGFELILKIHDGTPVCVKPSTVQDLIQRGWGMMPPATTTPATTTPATTTPATTTPATTTTATTTPATTAPATTTPATTTPATTTPAIPGISMQSNVTVPTPSAKESSYHLVFFLQSTSSPSYYGANLQLFTKYLK